MSVRRQTSTAWAGKRGEISLAEDMSIGGFVLKRGSYVLSQRLDDGLSVLVITAVAGRPNAGRLASRQLVTRSSVFAEELEDGSLQLRIAQIVEE